MLSTLAVENYRSIRHLVMPLCGLNVVTGPNGSGKSSLYRALRLLAAASRDGAIAALAREGGLPSTLWAGPEAGTAGSRRGKGTQGTVRTRPVALKLGFASSEFGYALDLGLPAAGSGTAFGLDPDIKAESIWHGSTLRPSNLLVQRAGGVVQVRSAEGSWVVVDRRLRPYDSMLGELADPQQTPEVLAVRDQMRSWRFYDHFRTDALAPARASQIGTRTPVLSSDGSDLAAALRTIAENGDERRLAETVDHAFPGSRLQVESNAGEFEVLLTQPGLLRPLRSVELSDGTLRYLLLVAALMSPRPPALLVLNEPETSLHPDLLAALADLVTAAAVTTQIMVVTHAEALITHLRTAQATSRAVLQVTTLVKDGGETRIDGQSSFLEPVWTWPKR